MIFELINIFQASPSGWYQYRLAPAAPAADVTPSTAPYFLLVLWKIVSPGPPILAIAPTRQPAAPMSADLLHPTSTDTSLDKVVHLAVRDHAVVKALHQEPEGKEETVLREEAEVARVVDDQSVVLRRHRRNSMPKWMTTLRRRMPMVGPNLQLPLQQRLPLTTSTQPAILRWRNRW